MFDGRKQTIWFNYVSESKTSITINLWDIDTRTPGARHTVSACVRDPVVRQSLWKRLSRLGKSSPPPPADPIAAAIDKAKDDILVADSFLKTDETSDRIHVRYSGVAQA